MASTLKKKKKKMAREIFLQYLSGNKRPFPFWPSLLIYVIYSPRGGHCQPFQKARLSHARRPPKSTATQSNRISSRKINDACNCPPPLATLSEAREERHSCARERERERERESHYTLVSPVNKHQPAMKCPGPRASVEKFWPPPRHTQSSILHHTKAIMMMLPSRKNFSSSARRAPTCVTAHDKQNEEEDGDDAVC